MSARLAALASMAATVATIVGITSFVITNAARLNGAVVVPGFVDIAFLHNRGVSFSLFAQNSPTGVHLLVLIEVLIIGVLMMIAYKNSQPVVGVGLGMIIGGALINNVIDRALHAEVFDYLAIHLGPYPLFVCNAPDIAITLGVLIWLAGEFFHRQKAQTYHPS